MSYHTSGSMSSYGGGYGTIKIHLQSSGGLGLGQEYQYKIQSSQAIHTATAERINGKIVLVDSNYTLGENPPPFSAGMGLTVFIPSMNIPLLTTVITDITPINEVPSGAEPMPTSPPVGVSAMNPMIGALSPQGQWTWSGVSWNNVPGPPLQEITMNLYNGDNVRTFHLRDEISINEFMSTVMNDVPIEAIQELDSNNEIVSSYEVPQPQPPGKSQRQKKKKKNRFRKRKKRRGTSAFQIQSPGGNDGRAR